MLIALLTLTLTLSPLLDTVDDVPAPAFGDLVFSDEEASLDFRLGLDTTWALMAATLRDRDVAVSDVAEADTWLQLGSFWVRLESLPYKEGTWTRVRVRVGDFASEDERQHAEVLLVAMARKLEDWLYGEGPGASLVGMTSEQPVEGAHYSVPLYWNAAFYPWLYAWGMPTYMALCGYGNDWFYASWGGGSAAYAYPTASYGYYRHGYYRYGPYCYDPWAYHYGYYGHIYGCGCYYCEVHVKVVVKDDDDDRTGDGDGGDRGPDGRGDDGGRGDGGRGDDDTRRRVANHLDDDRRADLGDGTVGTGVGGDADAGGGRRGGRDATSSLAREDDTSRGGVGAGDGGASRGDDRGEDRPLGVDPAGRTILRRSTTSRPILSSSSRPVIVSRGGATSPVRRPPGSLASGNRGGTSVSTPGSTSGVTPPSRGSTRTSISGLGSSSSRTTVTSPFAGSSLGTRSSLPSTSRGPVRGSSARNSPFGGTSISTRGSSGRGVPTGSVSRPSISSSRSRATSPSSSGTRGRSSRGGRRP